MLVHKTNTELIELIRSDVGATEKERELAERLFDALDELDNLVGQLTKLECKLGNKEEADGADARVEG